VAESRERVVLLSARGIAIGLGVAHAAIAIWKQRMNPDGICYLDMGDALARADWPMAVNAVWSPLYSLILGTVLRLVDPGIRWEYPLVHLVNLAVYLFALWGFDRLWAALALGREARLESRGEPPWDRFPKAAWTATGYGIFIFAALRMIKVRLVTPDMLMTALMLLALSVMLRARRHPQRRAPWLIFGALLGLGYLSKSVMLPMGLVLLAASALPGGATASGGGSTIRKARLSGVLIASLAFAVVAGPWIAVLSSSTGRFTFGEAGRITYAKYATNVPYPHWQGNPPDYGVARHPTRQLMSDPDVFEFAAPVAGTYPISYDPSYWYAGLRPRFDLRRQVGVISHSFFLLVDLFLRRFAAVLVVAAIFFAACRDPSPWFRLRDIDWALVVPGLVALAMYTVVLGRERYFAPALLMILCGLLASVPDPAGIGRPAARAAAWVMVVFCWLNIATFNARMAFEVVRGEPFDSPPLASSEKVVARPAPWRTAEALAEAGVGPGRTIGMIGDSGRAAFWARLAGVRIVAEVPRSEAEEFWVAGEERQTLALDAFRRAGVAAVVAAGAPDGALVNGWRPLGAGDLAIHVFGDPASR